MDKNIENYLKIYQNAISKEDRLAIIEKIESNLWKDHVFHDSYNDEFNKVSGDFEFEMSWSYGDLENKIMQSFWNSLFSYVNEINFSWFNSWSNISAVRFNRYKETTKMAEHCDHIHTLFDGEFKGVPVLSCLGILNDDFEGGELIFWENTTINVKAGDVLVFPSSFLYPHRVEPVTKGVRYSCVSWAW
jgi:hypothetical protein